MADIHLDRPITELDAGQPYEAARLLVRLHGVPLGEVRGLVLQGVVIEPEVLAKCHLGRTRS